jgi:hypothetical protein
MMAIQDVKLLKFYTLCIISIYVSHACLTSKIANESAITVSPSTNAGTYLIGFNLSNSVAKRGKLSSFQTNTSVPGFCEEH